MLPRRQPQQGSVWGLQAWRRNPLVDLCVVLKYLDFFQKLVSLRTRRHPVRFTRAFFCHAYIINLFHLVSPYETTSQLQRQKASAEGDWPNIFKANRK